MNFLRCSPSEFRLLAAILLLIPVAIAQERSTPPQVVTHYCSGCHGLNGRSQLPYIPRLAGLNSAYLERKLASFRTVPSSPVDEAFSRIAHIGRASKHGGTTAATVHMIGIAKAVSAEEIKAATEWYAAQQPTRGKDGKRKTIEEGRSVYLSGLQSQHLPACQSCHGPEAEGTRAAPRLAGQSAAYMLGQLALFRGDEQRQSPMTDIARSLESDQARAVALYLQSR